MTKKGNTCSRNSMYVLCCSEMSTKQNCYTWLLYCHILLRLQSMHQFLPAQFRVVPNEPLLAQVLCTHDHFCNHLMLLPALDVFFSLQYYRHSIKIVADIYPFPMLSQGSELVNKFFSHNNLCEEGAACL